MVGNDTGLPRLNKNDGPTLRAHRSPLPARFDDSAKLEARNEPTPKDRGLNFNLAS
jgi:hypothetical protein